MLEITKEYNFQVQLFAAITQLYWNIIKFKVVKPAG